MYRTGHMGINLILFSPILFILIVLELYVLGIFGLGFVFYFASIPDMDLNYWFLKHRGFTHTYSFALLFGLVPLALSFVLSKLLFSIGVMEYSPLTHVGILIGGYLLGVFTVIGHILGDIITPAGVQPLQKPKYVPDSRIFSDKKYTLSLVYAANQWANTGFLFLGCITTTTAIVLGGMVIT